MNPSLKFLTTCFIIAMIFIPFGFFYQLILLILVMGLYFCAKLPLKKLWKIGQSIIIMALLLTLINWITYKGPGTVFDFNDHTRFLFNTPGFLGNSGYQTTFLDGKWFLQGQMYGGKWLDSFQFISDKHGGINHAYTSTNGFVQLWQIIDKDTISINSVTYKVNSDSLFSELIRSLDSTTAPGLVGKLKYYSQVVYIDGNQYLYAYFYSAPWYGFSSEAISLMVYVSIKIFLMIIIVTVLTSTTTSIQLTCALEDILNPLRFLRLPISEWSTTIALGLRFIPSLLDESNRILKAQSSRGLDFKNGNVIDKVSALISLVVPLFSIAFKKAAELANAMEARGYNPRYLRTRYRDYGVNIIDWIPFIISCMLFGILITLVTIDGKPIFINVFGIWEALAMF